MQLMDSQSQILGSTKREEGARTQQNYSSGRSEFLLESNRSRSAILRVQGRGL
jgi:hypothetical protein